MEEAAAARCVLAAQGGGWQPCEQMVAGRRLVPRGKCGRERGRAAGESGNCGR